MVHQCFIAVSFPTCIHLNSLIPRFLTPPTVACKLWILMLHKTLNGTMSPWAWCSLWLATSVYAKIPYSNLRCIRSIWGCALILHVKLAQGFGAHSSKVWPYTGTKVGGGRLSMSGQALACKTRGGKHLGMELGYQMYASVHGTIQFIIIYVFILELLYIL